MDAIVAKEIKRIKNLIIKVVAPEAIYLFGSYANGTPSNDSDVDIYVIIPDSNETQIEIMKKIGNAILKKQIMPVDIVVGFNSEFQKRKNLPTLERKIFREGVLLYGQDEYFKRVV